MVIKRKTPRHLQLVHSGEPQANTPYDIATILDIVGTYLNQQEDGFDISHTIAIHGEVVLDNTDIPVVPLTVELYDTEVQYGPAKPIVLARFIVARLSSDMQPVPDEQDVYELRRYPFKNSYSLYRISEFSTDKGPRQVAHLCDEDQVNTVADLLDHFHEVNE